MFSNYLMKKDFVTVMNKSELLLNLFNKRINKKHNPLVKVLPIGHEPDQVLYRNQLFNQIDRNKSAQIRMQDTCDHFYHNKDLEFTTNDLKVLETAYQTIKMLQFNS
jgi:hypothetical protein